jgi:TolA-binding protein
MPSSDATTLRDAADAAITRGDAAEAKRLFRILLELYPAAPEALDAMYYMTSGQRRPAKRIEHEKKDAEPSASGSGTTSA